MRDPVAEEAFFGVTPSREKSMMADNKPNRENSSDDGGDTCAV